MNAERVLWVDDEPNILESAQRLLRRRFDLTVEQSPLRALSVLRSAAPFAVIVSDMAMPVLNGIQFLTEARGIAPDSARIMLTGNANQQVAIDAVNSGQILRFLSKPADSQQILEALTEGARQYRLVVAERELLQDTLTGAIRVLLDVLSLTHRAAFERSSRIRQVARQIAAQMKVDQAWQVEVAALLSQIGCISVSESTLARILERREVGPDELLAYENHPNLGAELIGRIPRLEVVAQSIALQHRHFDGRGSPAGSPAGERLPLGARILKVALDYDALMCGGVEHESAVIRLESRPGWYDPDVIEALRAATEAMKEFDGAFLGITELEPGMTLIDDVTSDSGVLIATGGQEVTAALALRLNNFARVVSPERTFRVLRPYVA